MAQHHEGPDCDTIPIKLPFHDTVIQAGQTLVVDATDKQLQGFEIVWQKWSLYAGKRIIGNTISITQAGTYSFYARNYRNNGCPDRAGDTLYVRAVGCDTMPIKHPFHDTTVYAGRECLLVNAWDSIQHALWILPDIFDAQYRHWWTNSNDISVGCKTTLSPDSLSIYFMDIFTSSNVKTPYTIAFTYLVESLKPECPEREGDTIHVSFVMRCDTTAVKSAFHDTAFCPGDRLLLVTSPWANRDGFLPVEAPSMSPSNFRTTWHKLDSTADRIYEGDSLFITEPGRYAFYFVNKVDNGCPDRGGDTINVAFWPKTQAFLPHDTLEACGSRSGALTFTITQPHVALRWSDGDTASTYRFAYRGDTLDKRFCTLTNVCGDTLTDSVTVRFLPPYAYLGGDSLVGCRGDSVLFDMGRYNRHLPAYDGLRFVWTLRGETIADGFPGDAGDPTRLKLFFPQDTGLLTVQVFLPSEDGTDEPEAGTDDPDAAPACPVAADTLDLQLYPWPDIDFFVRSGDTTICPYDSIPLFLDRDSLVFSPDAYYIWLFNDRPFDTTADKTIYAADSGLYTVTGVNYCSRHSESFVLSHYPKERITANVKDTAMCPDIPVEIDGTLPYEGNLYVWFSGGEEGGEEEGGEEGDRPLRFRNPDEAPEDPDTWPWDADGRLWVDQPGAYTLYIRDSAGCTSQTTVNITQEDCDPKFEAPNVFTPNGDGFNDVFKLKTMEKLFEFELQIFNRWGNRVLAFKGDPETFEWNGKIKGNGQDAADGVYFYVATYKDYKGKKKKQSGSVTILR